MRILYGVVGEGMGHAMRSRVILDELCKRHEVQVVVSGRAYDYLQNRASEHLSVKKIWGYTLVYEDNEVQNFKTLLENVKGAVPFISIPGRMNGLLPEAMITFFAVISSGLSPSI